MEIKTEHVCQQEDLQAKESEILSWHIKKEEEEGNESWSWAGRLQGGHLQEGGGKPVTLESTWEENGDPQLRIKKEKNDHTYASPREMHQCMSKLAAHQKTHTGASSSYHWPEHEQLLHPDLDFMGHPKIHTELKPHEWVASQKQSNHSSKWDESCSPAGRPPSSIYPHPPHHFSSISPAGRNIRKLLQTGA